MEDFGSLVSAVALWIGISCGLWWLHRRRTHGRQNRQIEQSRRAVALTAEAQAVFDAIRTPVPLETGAIDDDALLRGETHALLKRIQDHGGFFDRTKNLRVQIQASLGIEDHAPLSDLLHLRRDMWAASEILLVEDPTSLGETFAEPGTYERIRDEAVTLLFKAPDRAAAEEDLIDVRLSLAQDDAAQFVAALEEAVHDAREKDRLPTWSEVVAYPLAFFRAIPGALRTAYAFTQAFLSYSADAARAIRESDTMARGASRLQQAREDWPQRLSSGFERASSAARVSGSALRKHYDFLVTAYDFQTKYEGALRRAPDITERGRQFIARLELAEKSERLRLTSANAAIWVARRLVAGLAHLIAALQRMGAVLSETTAWEMGAALLAPVPSTGRHKASFPSYERALGASGLREARPERAGTTPRKEKAASKAKAAAKASPAPKVKAAKTPEAAPAKITRKAPKAAAAPTTKTASAPSAPKRAVKPAAKPVPIAPPVTQAVTPTPPAKPVEAAHKRNGPPIAQKPVTAAPPATFAAAVQPKADIARPAPEAQSAAEPRRWRLAIFATKDEPSLKTKPTTPAKTKDVAAPSDKPSIAAVKGDETALKPIPINAPKAVGKERPAEARTVAAPPIAPQGNAATTAPTKPVLVPREASPATSIPPAQVASVEPPPKPAHRNGAAEPAPAVEAPPAPIEEPSPPPAAFALEEFDYTPPPEPPASFLSRLFGVEARRQRKAQREADRIAAALAEAVSAGELAAPLPEQDGAPTLMAKLSSLIEAETDTAGRAEPDDAPDQLEAEAMSDDEAEADAEDAGEPGPLTLSILELRAKIEPKATNIRSFPWLRG
jgi:hypothetical protein